jgi:hypothetical protein
MKISCQCGAIISDNTDNLPHRGYLLPDQEWFATYDAIDDEVIDPLAAGRIEKEAAYWLARSIIGRSARLMYQCRACGRLYIYDLQGQLQCYLPESEQTPKEILRSR